MKPNFLLLFIVFVSLFCSNSCDLMNFSDAEIELIFPIEHENASCIQPRFEWKFRRNRNIRYIIETRLDYTYAPIFEIDTVSTNFFQSKKIYPIDKLVFWSITAIHTKDSSSTSSNITSFRPDFRYSYIEGNYQSLSSEDIFTITHNENEEKLYVSPSPPLCLDYLPTGDLPTTYQSFRIDSASDSLKIRYSASGNLAGSGISLTYYSDNQLEIHSSSNNIELGGSCNHLVRATKID